MASTSLQIYSIMHSGLPCFEVFFGSWISLSTYVCAEGPEMHYCHRPLMCHDFQDVFSKLVLLPNTIFTFSFFFYTLKKLSCNGITWSLTDPKIPSKNSFLLVFLFLFSFCLHFSSLKVVLLRDSDITEEIFW